MNAEEITKCIGIPHLTLENFELADPDTRYILTSPRSLQACDLCGLRPVELLRTPVEEFYHQYKDRDYLSRTDILDEFHLQEKVRLAKVAQAREERQRIIYLEAETEASKIPLYMDDKEAYSYNKSALSRSKSPTKKSGRSKSPKKVAWDASTKNAKLPLRSSMETGLDVITTSPSKIQKSWAESLRSPDPERRATSTPIKRAVSHEDITVNGSRSILKKAPSRSSSVPRKFSSSPNLRSVSEPQLRGDDELRQSYDDVRQTHSQLTANVTQLEQELKALKIQQLRDEAVQRKQANIDALKLQKQTRHAADKTRNSQNKLRHLRRVDQGASEHSLRNLRKMEQHNRTHLLRETQAHISELRSEIKQYKAQRSARLLQESRASWEELVSKRQSRALERADIKAQRRVRDVSAKARRMRLEKERRQSQNMRYVVKKQEFNLLKNLDNIISKDKKAEFLISEKERMLKKCRDVSRRSGSGKLRGSKSFEKMSHEAEMMAHLEARGTHPRWK